MLVGSNTPESEMKGLLGLKPYTLDTRFEGCVTSSGETGPCSIILLPEYGEHGLIGASSRCSWNRLGCAIVDEGCGRSSISSLGRRSGVSWKGRLSRFHAVLRVALARSACRVALRLGRICVPTACETFTDRNWRRPFDPILDVIT